jgi:hypothetical protein
MTKLKSLTAGFIESDESIGQMEKGYLKQVLSLCLRLLKFVISVKKAQLSDKIPKAKEDEPLRKKGNRFRKYLSLFGLLEFSRPSFWSKASGVLYPLDEVLEMPSDLWSYNIQEMTGANASETNFRESVRLMNGLLDLGLSDAGSKRNAENLGSEVGQYYEQKESPLPVGPVCFSASFDGKGVPKIKRKDKGQPKEIKRLGKGEKRDVKQMATVGVMSWFEPKERDVEKVINGLMGYTPVKDEGQQDLQKESLPNDNRWHQGIHRRAFLADQEKSIEYGIRYIKSMMHHPESRFVVPIDAGIGLEDKVLKYVRQYGLESRFDGIILDIVHVSEYVWESANALLGENSKLRTDWVREMLTDLLNSRTSKVIKDLERIIEKGRLSKSKTDKIQTAITYFTNHQHKMDYKSFLEKGYPVSSALVESNCKHLVKDRMEHSGMRWSSDGAQNMLDLRAVKLNGDMEDFISFISHKNRKTTLAKAA